MKTKLLFLFILLPLLNFAQAPTDTVYIPDPNFKDRLLDGGPIDANNDGEIEYGEAATVTELDLQYGYLGNSLVNNYNGPIEDLTGIEAFTNLTFLMLTDNALDSLDLSANTLLEELYVEDNNLVYLNLGNNTHLTILYCPNNNITDIVISQNINLQQVFLGHNKIDSLNLSGLDSLNYLLCKNNQLKYLDVRNTNIPYLNARENPNLTCIFVDDKDYANQNYLKDSTAHYVETVQECAEWMAVETNDFRHLELYPNPVKKTLYFSSSQNLKKIILFSLRGKKLSTFNNLRKGEIDFSSYSPGIYFLRIIQGNQSKTRKIIKL